jgi:ferric-dicitrate binding protein FerR (iron transport regulator)
MADLAAADLSVTQRADLMLCVRPAAVCQLLTMRVTGSVVRRFRRTALPSRLSRRDRERSSRRPRGHGRWLCSAITVCAALPCEEMPRLRKFANVIMTPHVSGWTQGMLEARAAVIAENIARIARREPPLHAIASG